MIEFDGTQRTGSNAAPGELVPANIRTAFYVLHWTPRSRGAPGHSQADVAVLLPQSTRPATQITPAYGKHFRTTRITKVFT